MKIITIDTTTRYGSIAIADGNVLLAEQLFIAGRSAAILLPQLIHKTVELARLTMDQLEGVGVAIGPGSFTGLRVGVAAAKGVAYSRDLPMAGFSSLALLALNFPHSSHQVCALHDARRHEVYAGLYSVTDSPLPLRPEAAISPEELVETIHETTIFTGEGATAYRILLEGRLGELARFASPMQSVPRAANAISLAQNVFEAGKAVSPDKILPLYLRLSEAEITRQAKASLLPESG